MATADIDLKVEQCLAVFKDLSREALPCPQLNLDDLSSSNALLILINARGQHHPKSFVDHDNIVTNFGHATQILEVLYRYRYEMRFWDHGNGPYISLVQGQVNQPMLLPAGEGLIVPEILEKILEFLVSACKLIPQYSRSWALNSSHPVPARAAIPSSSNNSSHRG